MANSGETAYITGAASGLGKAVAELLVRKGLKVFLADRNSDGVKSVADELNSQAGSTVAYATTVETTDWDSQTTAFSEAVTQFGRVDHVYPIAGIGERRWLPKMDPHQSSTGYEKPDLGTLEVDLTGFLYTVGIAIQQFRRQDVGKNGYKGKIGCVASVCGFYCAPTLPIYTTAKHGVTGFVRSYGKYLPQEKITLNAVNPNVVRTNISVQTFYDKLENEGLLTPLQGVVDAFEALLDGKEKDTSGEIFEIGPNYGKNGEGPMNKAPPPFLDEESRMVVDRLEERALPLQVPH